jgi:hypothetical protein
MGATGVMVGFPPLNFLNQSPIFLPMESAKSDSLS